MRLGFYLPGRTTITTYGIDHRRRIGETERIGIDNTTECRCSFGGGNQLGIGIVVPRSRPLATTLFEQPHTANILQETSRSFDPSFVGKILFKTVFIDNSIFYFDTHQRPCSRAKVSKTLVSSRNRSNGRGRIMTSNRYNRDDTQACQFLYLRGQCTYHFPGIDKLGKLLFFHAYDIKQFLLQLFGTGIENLRRRSNRIFGYHFTREHITECVGNEEYFIGCFKCRTMIAMQRGQLEQGIEIHHLNSRQLIYPFPRNVREIFFGSTDRMRVAITIGITQKRTIFPYHHKIDPPCIDTDRLDGDTFLGDFFQAFDDFEIKGINIPITMSSGFYNRICKTGYFFHIHLSVGKSTQNRTAAGSP